MSLQFGNAEFPFTGGINQKVADAILPPGQWVTLENCIEDKTGAFSKRNGYTSLSVTDHDTGTITSGRQLFTFKDQLLLADGTSLRSYDEGSNKWVDKGTYIPMDINSSLLAGGKATQLFHHNAVLSNGYYYYVYTTTETATDMKYSVVEAATGAVIQDGVAISATFAAGLAPKLIACGDYVVFTYVDSVTEVINFRCWNSTTPLSTGTTYAHTGDGLYLAGSHESLTTWAAADGEFFVAYPGATGTTTIVYKIDPSDGSTASVSSNATDTYVIAGFEAASGKLYLFAKDATDFFYFVIPSDYSTMTKVAIETILPCGVTAIETSTADTFTVLYDVISTNTEQNYIKSVSVNATAAGTPAVLLRSLRLVTDAFDYKDKVLFGASYETNFSSFPTSASIQYTMFLCTTGGDIVGRPMVGNWGGLRTSTYGNQLTSVISISSTQVRLSTTKLGEPVIGSSNTAQASKSLILLDLDFSAPANAVQLGDELFLSGGMLYSYDGENLTESGFHVYPQYTTAAGAASGGSMSNGAYSFLLVYEWFDKNGQIHRSAASDAIAITLSGGGSSQKVTLTVPTLRLTGKENVDIYAYRTILNADGPYYYVSKVANTKTADTASIVATASDTTILSNPSIYITGGVLDNIAPPACKRVKVWKNRLFAITADNKVIYSKEWTDGFGVSFSDAFYMLLNLGGHRVSDIASLDERFIIATEGQLFSFYGDGPNDAGYGAFSTPVVFNSEIGLKAGSILCTWQNGIFVPTNKGIWLIDKGLNASYIGAAVQDYKTYDVIAFNAFSTRNEVRFHLSGTASMLVFDLDHNRWSVFTNHQGVDAVIWDNVYCFLTSAGVVKKGNSTFKDDSTSITMKIKTSNLNLAGLAGYQRIKYVYILGQYKTASTLNVKVYYDDGTTQTISEAVTSNPAPYLFRLDDIQYPKCRQLQLEIYDSAGAGTEENFQLNALRIDVGMKSKNARNTSL